MKRIYVAGPISADTLIAALDHIREGQRASVAVLKAGYAPFSPFLDYQFQLHAAFTIEDYYRYSMAWLEVSDAVLLTGEWWKSQGVSAEVLRAKYLKIPVYETMEELCLKMPAS